MARRVGRRPTRSSPRASRRTECRSRPSRPKGVARRAGGPRRRRSDGRAQAAIAQGQRSREPEGHGGEVPPWRQAAAPEQRRSVASGPPPSRGPVAEGGSRCAGGRWVPAYLWCSGAAPARAEHGTGDPAMGLGGHCPSSSLSGPPPCEQGRLPTVSVGASKKNGLRAAIGRSETFSSIQLLSHGILIIGDSAGDFLRFRIDVFRCIIVSTHKAVHQPIDAQFGL